MSILWYTLNIILFILWNKMTIPPTTSSLSSLLREEPVNLILQNRQTHTARKDRTWRQTQQTQTHRSASDQTHSGRFKEQETVRNPSSMETVLGEQKEKKLWKRRERRERNESGSYLDIGLLVEQALGCCRRGERKRKHQHAGMGATVNITRALMVLGQTCHITVRPSQPRKSLPPHIQRITAI